MRDYTDFDILIGQSNDSVRQFAGNPDCILQNLWIYKKSGGNLFVYFNRIDDNDIVSAYALFSPDKSLLRKIGFTLLQEEDKKRIAAFVQNKEFDNIFSVNAEPIMYLTSGLAVLGYVTESGTLFWVNISSATTDEHIL